jgi:hypothetical protein
LEAKPYPFINDSLLLQAVEDGLIAYLEDAFDLHNPFHKGHASSFCPLRVKSILRHEEVSGKVVRFLLLGLILGASFPVVIRQVHQEMSELVGRTEYLSFNADPFPGIDDYGRTLIVFANG